MPLTENRNYNLDMYKGQCFLEYLQSASTTKPQLSSTQLIGLKRSTHVRAPAQKEEVSSDCRLQLGKQPAKGPAQEQSSTGKAPTDSKNNDIPADAVTPLANLAGLLVKMGGRGVRMRCRQFGIKGEECREGEVMVPDPQLKAEVLKLQHLEPLLARKKMGCLLEQQLHDVILLAKCFLCCHLCLPCTRL